MRSSLVSICLAMIYGCLGAVRAHGQDKYAQDAPPDAFQQDSPLAYYGSENDWDRRFFTEDQATRFDKRRGQRQMLAIQEGRAAEAAGWCEAWLREHPQDLETLFSLTVAWCQLGEPKKAWLTCQRALEAGLSIDRFVVGPRELLRPLTESSDFQQLLDQNPVRLIHGPMLGSMTDHSARFWVRTAESAQVTVQVFENATDSNSVQEAISETKVDADYTAVVEVTGLRPNTTYHYETYVDDIPTFGTQRPQFRTFPELGKPVRIHIGFGGCAGYTPANERIWDTIAEQQFAAFLTLGDNVYIDLPEQPGPMHRYTYYRRQSRPEFRRLVRSTPIFAIWDDHDCAIDDIWMGPYRDKPSWKQPTLRLFQQNWVNPAYGSHDWPACWFRFSVADIDFFMLDGRFYRENPFGEQPSMLGPAQRQWLLDGLTNSRATFKVIASPVSWTGSAKPGSHDTWGGFAAEREMIFKWLAENAIDGVVLLAADRHRSDAWHIERTQGYPLYEFMSSRLTNVHTHECIEGALICYNEKCSFGRLTFNTARDDPSVTYEIVNIDGEVVHSLTIHKSQLTSR